MVHGYDRRILRRIKEVDNMPLWLAVVLLALSGAGIALCRRYLRGSKTTAYILFMLACVLLAFGCIVYIGLTLLFVDAVRHQPPAP